MQSNFEGNEGEKERTEAKLKENYLDDSYESDVFIEKKEKPKNSVKLFGAEKKDLNMELIYKRMEDIHKLELKTKQEKSKTLNNAEFNEIFYNFKKK